uniref:Putative mfs-type transporter n=1 Tax=Ixodes scapularis TaxID=6945 RepID=A0A4D5S0G4_IXOSC
MVTLMLAWVIIGFNDPTLAPHTEQFNLNSMELGAVFMVPAISYAIGSLTAGLFCHLEMETFFAFCGQLMTVIAYLIIGPAPFFDTEPSLFSVCASIVLIGLGTAGQFICSFSNVLKYTMEQGYSDDVQTTGFVSSTVFGFLVIGGLISPPVGGYMVDTFGYRKGSMFMFALLLAWINDSSLLAQEVYPEDNAPRTVLKNDELHRTASAMSLDASGASSDGWDEVFFSGSDLWTISRCRNFPKAARELPTQNRVVCSGVNECHRVVAVNNYVEVIGLRRRSVLPFRIVVRVGHLQ